MHPVRLLPALLAAAIVLTLTSAASAQKPETYKGRLSPMPVDATNQAATTGVGTVTAVLTNTKLSVSGTFSGLQGPATIAQIHVGTRGIAGPAVLDLTVTKATSGMVQGELTLTAAQVDHLKRGRLYVQIHSEKAPEGNLRGWLLP